MRIILYVLSIRYLTELASMTTTCIQKQLDFVKGNSLPAVMLL